VQQQELVKTIGPATVLSASSGATATVSAVSDAKLGHLTGNAIITAQTFGGTAIGQGNAGSEFHDTITVVSNTGAPVDVVARLTLQSQLLSGLNGLNPQGVSGRVCIVTGPSSVFCADATKNSFGLSNPLPPRNSSVVETVSTTISSVPPGFSFDFQGFLFSGATALADPNTNGQSSVTADAIFTLDVLTPGASYITASGLDYATTPEPSTLILLGTALAGTGLSSWRKRRQRSESLKGR
jgi:hypothetical protein